ncbi:MAG: hypothetical protein IMZ62_13065 [Chloroflexi bacterium]|nr:hypothetical protein [Chloroflexota bacterium]MBE3119807.1 hypothetical protein [Candidatus Atribacteria bacterium]
MKRISLLLVLCLASFAVGQAAPVYKFPWVAEKERVKLNAPCDRTLLEWRCIEAKLDPRPRPLSGRFQLVGLNILPHPTGLLVKAEVGLKPGIPTLDPKRENMSRLLDDLSIEVKNMLTSTIVPLDANFVDLEIEMYHLGKLLGRRDVRGFTLAS